MPREWRFSVQFVGWRNRWAKAEPPRLVADATKAFVDRAAIDWIALFARVRTSSERVFFQNLELLDTIRQSTPLLQGASNTNTFYVLAVRLLVGFAAIQTACSFVVLAIAFVTDGVVTGRAPQVVLALAFVAGSLVLTAAIGRDARSLFLLGAFASIAGAFARSAATGLPEKSYLFIDGVFRGVFLEVFVPPCFWQFAVDFPRVERFTLFDVLARRANALVWLIAVLLFTINIGAAHQVIDEYWLTYILRNDQNNILWRAFMLALVVPVCTMLVRSHQSRLTERRKVIRFICALTIGSLAFLLFGLIRIVAPGVNNWSLTEGSLARVWIYRLVLMTVAVTPILCALAVVLDRPFELRNVLGHSSRRIFARATLTMGLTTPFVLVFFILYTSRHEAIAEVLSGQGAWWLLCCTAAGCLLLLARSRLLNALDKRLLHRTVDHHEQLERALQRVRVARGTREIAAVLTRELRKGTGAENVRILVPDHRSAFVDSSQAGTPLPTDSAIIAMLCETTRPLDLSADGPLHALLPKAERDWVASNDVSLVAALQHKDDELAAIAVLGPKRGGVPFDRRDRWLINALIAAASTAWDADASKDDEAPEPASRGIARINSRNEAGFECPRCGMVADSERLTCGCGKSPELAALPRHVGEKFVVERRLGAGGMGVVYLAHDMTLGRDVALKTLPELRPGAVTRLRDEARAMAALSHESLATIYGLELWRRTPVLVVEYFPHGTLAHKLADGALSLTETLDLGIDLARALDYIHARGMLHRDLKPSNVALTPAGGVKLLDFGLTTLITASASESLAALGEHGEIIAPSAGTPAYLPPEAYQRATPSPANDLWALAVTLLECLTGTNPFAADHREGTAHRILNADLGGISAGLVAPHPDLRAFFERALARRPEQRFQTAHDVGSALEALGNTVAAVNRGSN